MSSIIDKYRDYQSRHYVPIFVKDWYLDAVCDVPWDVVELKNNNDTIGYWTYMLKKKIGVSYIVPPQLCPFMGPIMFDNYSGDIDKLINQLPKHQIFIQDLFHNDDHLNLNGGNKWTYVFENIDTIEDIKLSSSTKRNIRKAEKTLTISTSDDFNLFYDQLEKSFTQQKKKNPYDKNIFAKLDRALSINNARKIFTASDDNNNIIATIYMLEDEKWVYNFANSYDNSYRHNGVSLLLWKIINYAFDKNKNFDFEGSMIPGVETFFRSFGGSKKMYHSIYRSQNILTDLIVKFKNPNIIR